MFKGNIDNVMAAAVQITERLRDTDVTLRELMKEYHCGWVVINKAVLSQMSKSQWKLIRLKKLAQGSLKGGGRFKPGNVPWTKGRKGIHLSPATEFKPGHVLRGQAARNYCIVGTIKLWHDKIPKRSRSGRKTLKDGSIRRGRPRRWIKVKDGGPTSRRWIPYARYVWEKNGGTIPDGHFVRHKDGNQMNDSPDNLHVVNRSQNLRLNEELRPDMRKIAHRLACVSRKRNTKIRRSLNIFNKNKLKTPVIWECQSCSAEYPDGERPEKCVKCGSYKLDRLNIKQRMNIG